MGMFRYTAEILIYRKFNYGTTEASGTVSIIDCHRAADRKVILSNISVH